MAHTQLLMALDLALGPGQEVVLAGEPDWPTTRALAQAMQRGFFPCTTVLLKPGGQAGQKVAELAPFTQDMAAQEGRAAAYVCQDRACQQPVLEPAQLLAALA